MPQKVVMNRIICIGNYFIEEDSAGGAVYEKLQNLVLPPDLKIVDGGIAGLGLLPHLEMGGRVVFVDAVSGFSKSGDIVVLRQEELLANSPCVGYGHEAGLAYLLTMLPHVCEGVLPQEISLVGLEGSCSEAVIAEAAELTLLLATKGYGYYQMGKLYAK